MRYAGKLEKGAQSIGPWAMTSRRMGSAVAEATPRSSKLSPPLLPTAGLHADNSAKSESSDLSCR
eukprot:5219125-Alexandrium_andersonii.AAC.1